MHPVSIKRKKWHELLATSALSPPRYGTAEREGSVISSCKMQHADCISQTTVRSAHVQTTRVYTRVHTSLRCIACIFLARMFLSAELCRARARRGQIYTRARARVQVNA